MALIEKLYSASETAKLLGISRSTLRQLTLEGDIHGIQLGQRVKYSTRQIEDFLEDRSTENA